VNDASSIRKLRRPGRSGRSLECPLGRPVTGAALPVAEPLLEAGGLNHGSERTCHRRELDRVLGSDRWTDLSDEVGIVSHMRERSLQRGRRTVWL
jgi:hypothetical protein